MSRDAFWRDLILMVVAMALALRMVAVLTFPDHAGWEL